MGGKVYYEVFTDARTCEDVSDAVVERIKTRQPLVPDDPGSALWSSKNGVSFSHAIYQTLDDFHEDTVDLICGYDSVLCARVFVLDESRIKEIECFHNGGTEGESEDEAVNALIESDIRQYSMQEGTLCFAVAGFFPH